MSDIMFMLICFACGAAVSAILARQYSHPNSMLQAGMLFSGAFTFLVCSTVTVALSVGYIVKLIY